ncbi:cytochrome p450 oxidoreductase [Diplodia corticola]|uniref:Choline monooxygenase, chloroplastic n=1 Tax=Diplodia corticola TaxID=236234 RepID=A0A1J9RNF1_9PEZI|nr:cytochrome p450 oxidoreductase [Diplodia corticola]OJD34067.1 cytochrome p450 oxidoreductase [Diplodia corticola]
MWRLLNPWSPADQQPPTPPPSRGLPSSWYRSPALYNLERRALFSRKWLLLTHTIRLAQPGDYLSFTIAGFSIFLIRDRDGRSVNAFHNHCRHRAYPVVQHSAGNAKILHCRYHGWAYGTGGRLAKAPRFEGVPGFEGGGKGLLPVKVHVDKVGFVWVNLRAGEEGEGEGGWEEEFGGADEKEVLRGFDFGEEFAFDHVWEMEVEANWKGVVENYNECYHCPTSHPLIAGVSDVDKYRVEPARGCLEHTIVNKDAEDNRFRRSITFFPPCTSVTVTDHFFYIQRMIPVSATTTRIENEVYRHRNATDKEFNDLCDFYKQVLEEDKELCVGAQRNLNAGVYVNGEFHPDKEKGPLHFQESVRKELMEHRKKEEQQGGVEIWPATPKLAGETKTSKLEEEEAFCSKLEAESCVAGSELAW